MKIWLKLYWLKYMNLLSQKSLLSANGPAVSLTTYGSRLNSVFLTLESISSGRLLPSKLILWLDDDNTQPLPNAIKRLQKRGLVVLYRENLKPHSKYYHYLNFTDTFNAPLVTADDDILYPKNWLHDLHIAYQTNPALIYCYRARRVTFNGEKLASYAQWSLHHHTDASYLNFATGVSGVIYPPNYLQFLKDAGKQFLGCCPLADDVWLHVNALRAGYKIKQLSNKPAHFTLIPGSQTLTLMQQNYFSDGNDVQIAKTYQASDVAFMLKNMT